MTTSKQRAELSERRPPTASSAVAHVPSRTGDKDQRIDERAENELPESDPLETNHRRPVAAGAAEPSEEDASIEQYMVALLDRSRKRVTADPAPIEDSTNQRESNTQAERQRVAREAPRAPIVRSVFSIVPIAAESKRRIRIDAAKLAALREVAIAEANLAIETCGRKRLNRTALATSSVALGCLLGAMLLLSTLGHHHTTLRALASIGFMGAVLWLFTAGHVVAVTVRRATVEAERNAS